MINIEERARLIEPILRKTMDQVIELRSSDDFEIITKQDGSPVTNADFWANNFLLEKLGKLFPGELMIGEENDRKEIPTGTKLIWFFDPIDGTKNYISMHNPFHILLGISIDGEPVMGICAYPLTGNMIVGGEQYPAEIWHRDGSIIPLSRASNYSSKSMMITLKGFSDVGRNQVYNHPLFEKAKPVLGHPSIMGPAFSYSEAYIDHRDIHWWDLCGPAAIMRSLGYEVGRYLDNSSQMNNGDLFTDRFFCFPPGTPKELKEFVIQK